MAGNLHSSDSGYLQYKILLLTKILLFNKGWTKSLIKSADFRVDSWK